MERSVALGILLGSLAFLVAYQRILAVDSEETAERQNMFEQRFDDYYINEGKDKRSKPFVITDKTVEEMWADYQARGLQTGHSYGKTYERTRKFDEHHGFVTTPNKYSYETMDLRGITEPQLLRGYSNDEYLRLQKELTENISDEGEEESEDLPYCSARTNNEHSTCVDP